jgi:hypothetical protein
MSDVYEATDGLPGSKSRQAVLGVPPPNFPRLTKTVEWHGKVIRVNVLLAPRKSCSNVVSLWEDPPEVLFQNGFNRQKFDEWIARLNSIVGVRPVQCCEMARGICCIFGTFPCLCVSLFCISKLRSKEITDWDNGLREWQDEFNRQALAPCGMFVKTRSVCITETLSKGQARHVRQWLTFAIGEEEIAKLKSEPHVEGALDSGLTPCGRLPDESQLCMHP